MKPDEIGSWRNCLAVVACSLAGAVLGGAAMFFGLDYLTMVFAPQARQGQYGLHFLLTMPVGVVVGGLLGGIACYCVQVGVRWRLLLGALAVPLATFVAWGWWMWSKAVR